jgi:hypothetical protein
MDNLLNEPWFLHSDDLRQFLRDPASGAQDDFRCW